MTRGVVPIVKCQLRSSSFWGLCNHCSYNWKFTVNIFVPSCENIQSLSKDLSKKSWMMSWSLRALSHLPCSVGTFWLHQISSDQKRWSQSGFNGSMVQFGRRVKTLFLVSSDQLREVETVWNNRRRKRSRKRKADMVPHGGRVRRLTRNIWIAIFAGLLAAFASGDVMFEQQGCSFGSLELAASPAPVVGDAGSTVIP